MDSRSSIPRTGISPEARAWLEANPPSDRVQIGLENAAKVRAAIRWGWAPSMKAARDEFAPTETSIEIGGVSCLEVTGPAVDGTVLYFFGGGHTVGSPEEDIVIAAPLAVDAGARVIAVRYPLAPEDPYPAALDAAEAVYRALLDEVGDAPLVVAGESAGGNLTLALMQRARDAGLRMPTALALLSPWGDLAFGGDSAAIDRDPTLVLGTGELQRMADLYRGAAAVDDPLVSPVHADFTGFPPAFITTGTRDLLLSDCVRISTAMRADGVDATLRVWEGMWHVFEFYRDLPEARASMAEICDWVRARLDGCAAALDVEPGEHLTELAEPLGQRLGERGEIGLGDVDLDRHVDVDRHRRVDRDGLVDRDVDDDVDGHDYVDRHGDVERDLDAERTVDRDRRVELLVDRDLGVDRDLDRALDHDVGGDLDGLVDGDVERQRRAGELVDAGDGLVESGLDRRLELDDLIGEALHL
ncbi:MAG: alpha/beta hydrolase [Actinomycetota bacterium]